MLAILAAATIGLGARSTAMAGPSPTAYGEWLASTAIKFDQSSTGAQCDTAKVESSGADPGGQPIFRAPPPDTFIDESVIEHVKFDGCGHTRALNILVMRLASGGWRGARMLDGASRTTPLLQRNAMQTAVPLMLAGICPSPFDPKQIQLGPVTMLHNDGDRGFTERWTATACGKAVAVDGEFAKAADGGTDFVFHRVGRDGHKLIGLELSRSLDDPAK